MKTSKVVHTMSSHPREWIAPKWEDPNAYEYLNGEKDSDVWAWEFLRRNTAYQEQYFELQEMEESGAMSKSEVRDRKYEISIQFKIFNEDEVFNPTLLTPPNFKKNHALYYPAILDSRPGGNSKLKGLGKLIVPVEQGDVVVVLSTNQDIKKQLDSISKKIKNKKNRPYTNELFIIRLRVYDADAQGNSIDESLRKIYSDTNWDADATLNDSDDIKSRTDSLSNFLDEAGQFVSGGYIKLIYRTIIDPKKTNISSL